MQNMSVLPLLSDVLRRAVMLAVPALLLLAIALGIIYQVRYTGSLETIETEQDSQTELLSRFISNEFDVVAGDLFILANSSEIQDLLDENSLTNRETLAELFLLFSSNTGRYDQIRYIDETGLEIVRVNYNKGEPILVAEENLQNQGERYYFKDTVQLQAGQIFVSPLDLNIERGEVEQPLKPMIRFATPLVGADGTQRGIVIVNYFASQLLDQLSWITPQYDSEIMLLNKDGYWLKGPTPEDEWGFMYEDRLDRTFGNAFSAAWPQMNTTETGQFQEDGLYTFVTVFPLLETWQSSTGAREAFASSEAPINSGEYSWKLVSVVPATALTPQKLGDLDTLLFFGGILVVAIIGVAYFVARLLAKRALAEQEIKSQRNELALQNVTLEKTNLALDLARQEAENANRVKSQFLTNMSHELRTPLNAILNFTKFVSSGMLGEVNPQQIETMDRVVDNGKHLLSLINDLLDISKIEAGQLKLFVEDDVDLSKEFHSVAEVAQAMLASKPVELRLNLQPDLPLILGDRRRTRQIMLNLVSNACKFTEHGNVTMSLSHANGQFVFSVQDTGIGIAKEDHDLVFETFRQTHEGLKKGEGTGLGLPISKRLTEILEGSLTMKSEPGKGSTFTVQLPSHSEALTHLKHEQEVLVPA